MRDGNLIPLMLRRARAKPKGLGLWPSLVGMVVIAAGIIFLVLS